MLKDKGTTKMTTMPRRRTDNLVVQEMEDETLVYDLDKHKAHCLNGTAATVWRSCDGASSVGDVAAKLHAETGLPADEKIVLMAIRSLEKARLLDGSASVPPALLNAGRREALKRIGIVGGAAAMLPLVTSILAPTAALAITCVPAGGACMDSSECCGGLCEGNVCVGNDPPPRQPRRG